MRPTALSLIAIAALISSPTPGWAADPATPYDVRLQVVYRQLGVADCAVDLVVDGQPVISTGTDSDGRVAFLRLSTERFEVVVRRPGYFPRRVIYYNFTRKDIVGTIALKKRIRWMLSGSVRGSGQMLPAARVTLLGGADSQEEATTDSTGSFAFKDMYDTECRFRVQANGFRKHTTWSANREQKDLHFDVALLPQTAGADPMDRRGDPTEALFFTGPGWPGVRRYPAESASAVLSYLERIAPGAESPRDGVALAWLICPYGAPPQGALARADRVLGSWVQAYPPRCRTRPELPFDPGTTGWGRSKEAGQGAARD
ncbi:MAG: carboxypeptidase regulatory-like domain-containing protein [Candidatus Riflebacteria bacterium]|nr:carboxypeptidase regulatory-like domain-containing protein [Candidatus Riflebacteria bacterium]